MTLAQLIARFRTEANDQAVPYFCSDADVTAWLNDAVNEACIRARLIHESSNETVTKITVVAGTAVYALHASLYELDHIRFVDEDDNSNAVRLVSTEWLDGNVMSEWRAWAGTPQYAVQTDKHIRLVPKPDIAGSVMMEGYRLPITAMSQGTDTPEIHAEHHRHLVHWALHQGFSIPDSEFFDKDRSAKAEAAFTQYFGLRPDADLRRITREDVPQHVEAFWP